MLDALLSQEKQGLDFLPWSDSSLFIHTNRHGWTAYSPSFWFGNLGPRMVGFPLSTPRLTGGSNFAQGGAQCWCPQQEESASLQFGRGRG